MCERLIMYLLMLILCVVATFNLQSVAKTKNVVMSTEAMREMAKQAKATRDERRTQVRDRYAYS